uniref:Tetratricopeptide repeat protein n=1 Tax=candidate division WOR-3 bacterium TaxID=2052148 RepID=A0A7C4XFN3_UNCW3
MIKDCCFKLLFIPLIILEIACSQKEEHIKNARRFIKELNYERALIEILNYRESNDTEIQYLLGFCYLKKNEPNEAKVYFKNCLEIDTLFKDSIITLYNNLAKNALRISDLNKALALYQDLSDLVPDYKEADNLFLIGDLNFEQGNYPSAISAYKRAFSVDSTSPVAKKSIKKFIKSLVECDSIERALKIARAEFKKSKVAENVLQLGEIEYLMGLKFFNQAELDSARNMFTDVIAMGEPKSLLDDSYFYLGEIQYAKDSLDRAIESYKKVLRLNPYQKGELVKKAQERIKEIKEKR